MNTSTRRILFLVVILLVLGAVVLAAAFLWLDFRLLRGEMTANSSASTYSFSIDEDSPLPLEQDLDLYVEAPPLLEEELAAALTRELSTNPYVRDITLRQAPPRAAENSVLVVEVKESSDFWSPVYTRSSMTVQAAYASDGQVDWIDEDVVVFESHEPPPPTVRTRATYTFEGRAYGLISRPGYASYVANEVAARVNASLAETLTNQGSGR